jgi:hypothetical protein
VPQQTRDRPTHVVFVEVGTGRRHVVDARPDPLCRRDAWVSADGLERTLDEMETRHIERVIAFLRRRSRSMKHGALGRLMRIEAGVFGPQGDAAQDAFEREFAALLEADPREWIEEVPIMRALKAELVLRHEPWGVA